MGSPSRRPSLQPRDNLAHSLALSGWTWPGVASGGRAVHARTCMHRHTAPSPSRPQRTRACVCGIRGEPCRNHVRRAVTLSVTAAFACNRPAVAVEEVREPAYGYRTSRVSNPVRVQSRGWCGSSASWPMLRTRRGGGGRAVSCGVLRAPRGYRGDEYSGRVQPNTPRPGCEHGHVRCAQSTAWVHGRRIQRSSAAEYASSRAPVGLHGSPFRF